jgi:hypothetical protein
VATPSTVMLKNINFFQEFTVQIILVFFCQRTKHFSKTNLEKRLVESDYRVVSGDVGFALIPTLAIRFHILIFFEKSNKFSQKCF